ncbi:hypothetical protein B0H13DRAFT_2151097 [Mycena leptocephala]|nr:hypothetical protein B0H13DRAFT_2151097 [Mycena leptocephala]
MSESVANEPRLLPELEREIFDFAAVHYPTKLPDFLRVCRRVHWWLEPLLYRVLDLDKPLLVNAIQSVLESEAKELAARHKRTKLPLIRRILRRTFRHKPPLPEAEEGKRTTFLKNTVRHIHLTMLNLEWTIERWNPITRILLLNPALFELIIDIYSSPVAGMTHLMPPEIRPTRLTVQFRRPNGNDVDLADPIFSSVTHLTLLNFIPEGLPHMGWTPGLSSLGALTHLCVKDNFAHELMSQALSNCRGLRALVVMWMTHDPPAWAQMRREANERMRKRMHAFARGLNAKPDARVVLVAEPHFYEEWTRGARSGFDMWVRVDAFIACKRRGEIEASDYIMDHIPVKKLAENGLSYIK